MENKMTKAEMVAKLEAAVEEAKSAAEADKLAIVKKAAAALQ